MENKTKKREGWVLALVAGAGLIGLLALQFLKKEDNGNGNIRTIVQNQDPTNQTGSNTSNSGTQYVPVTLLRESMQPEMNLPFVFEITDFTKGGVYTLDPGDGSARQTFQEGKLTYTYRKPGVFKVTIFTLDGDKELPILTCSKQVANLTEEVTTNKKSKKPFLDD